jgi:hypothetical protein
VKQLFPLTGKGPTAVSHLILKILETDKLVQKIVLEVGKPVVIETLVPKDSALSETVDVHDVIRNHTLVEYLPEGEKGLYEQLAEMYRMVNDENLQACYLVAGNQQRFVRAFKMPLRTTQLFGLPILTAAQVPGDVFFLCGAPELPAEPADILLSVKGALP